ncbi:hypothetical protein Nepgr_017821 [Nepenthes gracilis]|uniref:Protein NRT1/ PTR FAMILY 1.2-like n=1 Tax=Nepenthes gracilis TaxID=150966 RepID=A0AAD3SQ37_NEPGR|nr:hypothetical protein Nepgr_017821 [Nepenthes gracilis]
MEASSEERKTSTEQGEEPPKRRKGGLITMPFIIANESFEKVASYGLLPNMISYLMKDYRMSVAKGTNLIFFWSAATNFMPLVGAFLADSFLGRFLTIALGSLSSLLGMIVLWLTTMIPHAKPPPCNSLTGNCKSPTAAQYAVLVLAFVLMSIGAGGVRPCSQAFGADQVDRRDNPKRERVLETFFNWYYATSCFSVLIALTVIVYIQDHLGWRVGFGVPAILMLLSALIFLMASPLYIRMKPRKSLLTSFAQVAVAACRNRGLAAVPRDSNVQYHHAKDSTITTPSNKLRFLNKACIIRDPEQDIGLHESAKNPWRLCTVEEVEELKVLIKVIPIWSSGIMMSINTSQSSFQLLQAKSMNRHLASKFQIPAGSFGMFTIITIVLWIPLYDRVFIPLASRLRGKPARIGVKVRMGLGLFCSFMAMVISGTVENIRRRRAILEGHYDDGQSVVDMSALWLVPQYCLHGFAEAFNAIGQTEFYYSEFPKSMSSIATSLFGLGMAVANLLASIVLSTVDNITSRGGKESWVSSNINKGRYDYYYWLLAVLSFGNLLYYLACSWAYGPCAEPRNKINDERNGFEVEDESRSGKEG